MDEVYKRSKDIPRILVSKEVTLEDIEELKRDLRQDSELIDWAQIQGKALFYVSGRIRPEDAEEFAERIYRELEQLPAEKNFLFNVPYFSSAVNPIIKGFKNVPISSFFWIVDGLDTKMKEIIEEFNDLHLKNTIKIVEVV